jgi:hypothetical protein
MSLLGSAPRAHVHLHVAPIAQPVSVNMAVAPPAVAIVVAAPLPPPPQIVVVGLMPPHPRGVPVPVMLDPLAHRPAALVSNYARHRVHSVAAHVHAHAHARGRHPYARVHHTVRVAQPMVGLAHPVGLAHAHVHPGARTRILRLGR